MADHRATKKSQLSKPSAPLKIQRRGNDRKERRRSIEYRRYFDPRWISVIRLSRVFLEWNAALALFSRRWRGEERGKGRKRENENGLVWFEARIAVYVGIEKGSCRNEVVKRFFTPPFARHEAASRAVSHPVESQWGTVDRWWKKKASKAELARREQREQYFSSESCKCVSLRFDFSWRKEIIRGCDV